jgi:hypothetical protein
MGTPRWRVWLHRIGYVTTVIVAVELCAIAVLFSVSAIYEHRRWQAVARRTAYKLGPLPREEGWTSLDGLPPPASLGPDGFRFVAAPGLGYYVYGLSFRGSAGGKDAIGRLIVDHQPDTGPATRASFECRMRDASYRRLMAALDRELDGFSGDGAQFLDGTSLGFERTRGGRTTSGTGNLITPYRQLAAIVLRHSELACPGTHLSQLRDDWYMRR